MTSSPYRPAENITLASEGYEEKIALRRVEWKRIRNRVEKLENPVSDASSWFEIAYGTAAGTAVSLLLLLGAGDAPGWLVATLIILVLAAVVVGAFMQNMAKKVATVQHESAVGIVAEMDEIELAFVKKEKGTESKQPAQSSPQSVVSAHSVMQGTLNPVIPSTLGNTLSNTEISIADAEKKLTVTPEGKIGNADPEPQD